MAVAGGMGWGWGAVGQAGGGHRDYTQRLGLSQPLPFRETLARCVLKHPPPQH